MSSVAVEAIHSAADETPPVFKDIGGSREIIQGAWAWASFDGSGTPAVEDSFNVDSITDNGTGDYTLNFSANLPNANYSVIGSGAFTFLTTTTGVWVSPFTTKTVGAVRLQTSTWSTTRILVDSDSVHVAILCNP